MTDSTTRRPRWKGRLQLLLIIALPLLAVAAALLYQPSGTMHHGELVVPPRPLSDVRLQTLEGKPLRFSDLKGKWTYIYFGSAACPAVCRDNLYKMRQVRLARGKDRRRVQYLFVLDAGPARPSAGLLRAHHEAIVASGPPAQLDAWARQFAPGGDARATDRVYLVDPLGNLMMSYGPDADPTGMNKDLARLLKVSRIG